MPPQVKYLAADGATALQQQNWPQQVSDIATVLSTPLKFSVDNNGTRALGVSPFTGLFLTIEQVGTNDGWTFARTALDSVSLTLSKPWGAAVDGNGFFTGAPTAVVTLAGGGSWTPGTYGIKVTATNAAGETVGSVEVTFVIANATDKATITWNVVAGATGYKVYLTPTPGTYGATSLRATIGSGGTVTYDALTQTGLAAGTPPLTNTSGGAGPAFGTPPADGAFTSADKSMGAMSPGQQFFFWGRLVIPPGQSEVGNQRVFRILPKEV